jgi:tetratricopeptide (TPR) repeat protein
MKSYDLLRLGGALLFLILSTNQSLGSTQEPLSETRETQAGVLRANTEALLERIRANGKQQAADASYQLSLAAAGRHDLDAAYPLIQEATRLAPEQAVYQQAAAYIAYSLERFEIAIEHTRLQLELVRAKTGAGDPAVANVLENLGAIYTNAGKFDDAQKAFEQSLAIRRQSFGDNHPAVVIGLNRLANLARKQYREEVAERYLQQALSILKETYGDTSSKVAIGYQNLGEFYLLQQRFEDAEAAYLKALGIADLNPPRHTQLSAANLYGLGRLYLAQDKLDDAQERFEELGELVAAEFGEQHPYAVEARRALAQVERARAQAAVSENLYRTLAEEFSKQTSMSPRANGGPESISPLSSPITASDGG